MGDPNNNVTFSLQSDETTFEVTKFRTYSAQGNTMVCSTFGRILTSSPTQSLPWTETQAFVKTGRIDVVCEVSDPNGAFAYTPTWTASANADTSVVNLALLCLC